MPTNKIHTLRDLIIDMARDMLDAEKQLTKALPKMAKAASSPELKQAFEHHLEETNIHVERLQQALQKMEGASRAKKCHGMQGILEEGEEQMALDATPEMKDMALIAAAQKVEHYEISSYGCLCEWAKCIGETDVKKILGDTLEEEKRCDELLTKIAEKLFASQHVGTA